MDQDTAQFILNVIASVGLAVWLLGLCLLVWATQADRIEADPEAEPIFDPDLDTAPRGPRLHGVVEVRGQPEELSGRAAVVLARWMVPGALAVEERHNHRVVFGSTGLARAWGLAACRRGVLDFKGVAADRTLIHYEVVLAPRRWLLGLGAAFQVIGLVVLIVGFWALSTYVVQSANPMLRYQVVQMLQVVHFLWPPFLFAFLYRALRRSVGAQVRGLVQNLPYLDPDQVIPHSFRHNLACRRVPRDPEP